MITVLYDNYSTGTDFDSPTQTTVVVGHYSCHTKDVVHFCIKEVTSVLGLPRSIYMYVHYVRVN